MLYINSYYLNFFDEYNSSYSEDSKNKYIVHNLTDNTSIYCKKVIDASSNIWNKISLLNVGSGYHADISVCVTDNGTDTIIDVFDSYTQNGLFGYTSKMPVKTWFEYVANYALKEHDDGKTYLHANGIISYGDNHTTYDDTYYTKTSFSSSAKITAVYVRASFNFKNFIIADFKLNTNDSVLELPVSAHGTDFVENSDGSFCLSDVGKVGTTTFDVSGIDGSKTLLGAAYNLVVTKNNDDINAMTVDFGGNEKDYTFTDEKNIISQAATDSDKTSFSAKITAKKV